MTHGQMRLHFAYILSMEATHLHLQEDKKFYKLDSKRHKKIGRKEYNTKDTAVL